MFGSTPPLAMVTPAKSRPSSSSFLTANCTCLGLIRVFLLSRAAFPANSSTCITKKIRSEKWKHKIPNSDWKKILNLRAVDVDQLPQRRDTPARRRGRSEPRNRFAGRSGPSLRTGRSDPQGIGGRLWRTWEPTSFCRRPFFLRRLWWPWRIPFLKFGLQSEGKLGRFLCLRAVRFEFGKWPESGSYLKEVCHVGDPCRFGLANGSVLSEWNGGLRFVIGLWINGSYRRHAGDPWVWDTANGILHTS